MCVWLRQTLLEIDELLKYVDRAETELQSAEPVSADPETLALQLAQHKVPRSSSCSSICLARHLRPSGVLSCRPDGLELTPGFYPGSNEQHRLFKAFLKRTCSRVTSASSSLGVLNDYALYKSTHSLTSAQLLKAGPQTICSASVSYLFIYVFIRSPAHSLIYLLQLFNGFFSRTTWVSRYQKGKTNLDFTGARDSEWQWHQLGHMQVCTSLQTDTNASTPPLCYLQTGCPSCRPTNSEGTYLLTY